MGDPVVPACISMADSVHVRVRNIVTGAMVADFNVGPEETGLKLKEKLSGQSGEPAAKIRLLHNVDDVADSWLIASAGSSVDLGMCVVQRTKPEHIHPMPL